LTRVQPARVWKKRPHIEAANRIRWGSSLSFLGILALAAALRIVFFSGITASDPLGYIQYAYQIAQGTYELEAHHYATRFAVLLPVALSFKIFGVSQFSALLWPCLCSLLTFYLVIKIGALLGGLAAGLLAGAFLAVLPLDIYLSTNLFPETVLTAMVAASVYCYYRGHQHENPSRGAFWLLASGAALWLAFSAKMLGAFLVPAFVAHTGLTDRRWKSLLWVLVPLGLLVLFELTHYRLASGDWLFRMHAVASAHESSVAVATANQGIFDRLFKAYARISLLPTADFGMLFPFVWIGVAYTIVQRRGLILLLWFFSLFAYINFGTSNLRKLVFLPVGGRYLHPVIVPGLILLAIAIVDVWRVVGRRSVIDSPRGASVRFLTRTALTLAVASLMLFGVAYTYVSHGKSYVDLTAREVLEAGEFLRSNPGGPVYTDSRSLKMLHFAFGFQGLERLRRLPAAGQAKPAVYLEKLEPGSLLLLNWREIRKEGPYARLSPSAAEILHKLAGSSCVRRRATFWREPARLYYRLASHPLFASAVIRDTRREYFGPKGGRRGTEIFSVGSRPLRADLRNCFPLQ
jgi:hypothetical protein